MLEIRLLDSYGYPRKTSEDKEIPFMAPAVGVSAMLVEYCWDKNSKFIKPVEVVRPKDMALAVYNRFGLESLLVAGKRIKDAASRQIHMKFLAKECVMTKYDGKDRKDIFVFYIPPYKRALVEQLSQYRHATVVAKQEYAEV